MLPVLFACVATFPPPPAATAPRVGDPAAPVIYELSVPSFQDSDGDGVGDLDGARMRLDYLASLGVTDVWLLPLGLAADPGGWDAVDPTTIDPRLGGPDALHRFVVDAHDRELRVGVDLPVDHLAADAALFQAAEGDGAAPERAVFRFAELPGVGAWFPAEGGGWYGAAGGEARPDLDGEAAAAREEVATWIAALGALGVDTVRLYRLDRFVATPAALAGLADGGADDDAEPPTLAADVHGDSEEAREWRDAGLGLVGDPWRATLVRRALSGEAEALLTRVGDAHEAAVLDTTVVSLTPTRGPRLPTLLPEPELRRAALVATLLLPGVPRLYYGEELDLADARGGDPEVASLAPMPWDTSRAAGFTTGRPWMEPDEAYLDGVNVADELEDPESPLRLVKALADLRAASPAARAGAWTRVPAAPEGTLAWTRGERDEVVLVVVNAGPAGGVEVEAPGEWLDLTAGLARASCSPRCRLGPLPRGGYRVLARGVATPHEIPP